MATLSGINATDPMTTRGASSAGSTGASAASSSLPISPTTTPGSTPTVPTLGTLQAATPSVSTIGSVSAGSAPTATSSDAGTAQTGLLSTAQAQNANAADITPAGQINPLDSTNAASQLDAITSANSPYIQQAEQQGLLTAASRGLENSSLGSGAAEAAAVQAAAPLAQQNASEAAAAGLQNSQLGTQASEFNSSEANANSQLNAQLQTQTNQLNAQLAGQTSQFNASQAQAAEAANQSAENAAVENTEALNEQINQQYLSGTQAEDLASIQGQYNQLIATNQAASNLYQSYFSSIASTMANQNIDPTRVAETVQAQQAMLQSGLEVIDSLNGGSGGATAVMPSTTASGNTLTTSASPPPTNPALAAPTPVAQTGLLSAAPGGQYSIPLTAYAPPLNTVA